MTYSHQNNAPADHLLYRTYWKLCLGDILFHLNERNISQGLPPIVTNTESKETVKALKKELHEFHKRVLGYETTSHKTQEVMSRFIAEVYVFWSVEQGIFVRTSKKQPLYIEGMGLSDLVDVNGVKVRVFDLL